MENVFFEFEEKIMSRNHRLIVGSVMFKILEYDFDLEISLDASPMNDIMLEIELNNSVLSQILKFSSSY